MNDYEKTLLEMLSYKYPGYLFEFDEYPSMIMVWIKNKSAGVVYKDTMPKYKNVSYMIRAIERMVNDMREEEELNRNVIRPGNKYSIAPKEVIFQDEKTTIINWTDGTKTIVKCSDDDTFSPEAGIALCYMKKFITDNDPERFHRILKSLISVSKFKNSKQEDKNSGINKENLERQAHNMLPIDLGSLYQSLQDIKEAFSRMGTMEEKYDIDTGTPVNSGNNDTDGSSVEVES